MAERGLTRKDIERGIAKAKQAGSAVILRDTGRTRGLEVVISYGGTATFMLRYTDPMKTRRRVTLGRFSPEFGIAEAREKMTSLRGQMVDGIDPVLARDQDRAEQRAALDVKLAEEAERKAEAERLAKRMTVEKLSGLYFAARAADRGMARMRQMIEFSVLPVIGSRIVDELRKADVQRVMDEVAARGNATQPQRVLEALRPMLKWALEREYMPADREGIWLKLRLPKRAEARERVLTAREIAWLWDRTEEWMPTEPALARIIRLDALTGQRSQEVCGMRLDEIPRDGLAWTLPAARAKNNKPHTVPLPPMAREIVAGAIIAARDADPNATHLFVGGRGKVFRADTVAHRLADAISAWNDAHAGDQIEPFVVHDLRRTLATRLEEAGASMTVIETVLNHVSAKAASVTRKHYSHGDLSLAVRAALTKWQALVQQCIAGHDPFSIRVEDIEAIEARALAEVSGGKPRLQVVKG